MPLSAKLVVVGGEVKTAEIKLRLPSTIGRGRGATIMLPHPLVSRQHCELYEAEGQLMVRDLGSLNGTFVNNQRVTEAPLPPGELLTIGTVTFRAVYESESQIAAGAPRELPVRPQDTDPDGTLRAMPKPAAPMAKPIAPAQPAAAAPGKPSNTPPTEDADDFDFGDSLMEFDDEDAENEAANRTAMNAADAAAPVEDLDEVEMLPPTKPAGAAPAKPAPPAEEAARNGTNEEDEESTAEDDDFDDFLKSLGK